MQSIDIDWPCNGVVLSVAAEVAMRPICLRQGEFGRGRDLPPTRLSEIDAACDAHGMTRFQALSLRRQLLRAQWGNACVNQSPAMGNQASQAQAAKLFEDAVAAFLSSLGHVQFLTEGQLLAQMRAGQRRRGPTPDILFTSPTRINGHPVTWLDCKLYYGTALLANNRQLSVGKLGAQAMSFNRSFGGGGGAFVFGQSFCAALAVPGAILLDASPVDMGIVNEFQIAQG